MKFKNISIYALAIVLIIGVGSAQAKSKDLTEEMKKSLVHLNISAYAYEVTQPWKHGDAWETNGYACAVSEYEVLTTAWNVAEASFIKVRRHGQNEFIPAKVKICDYETNLCLLELDKDAMDKPMVPIKFYEKYEKGIEVQSYWLSSGGHLTTGRGYLDRAEVKKAAASFAKGIEYIIGNTSHTQARARIYCIDNKAIGIACWSDDGNKESGLIPGERINRFLKDAKDGDYKGVGIKGFAMKHLLDPAMRGYLKMPEDMKHGVYVRKVYTLGTGSDVLKKGDVILEVDGKSINPYGRYLHKEYDRIALDHIIASHNAGEEITFTVWRDGKKTTLKTEAKNFKADDMLVPYYGYDKQPEYIITAGFVMQKLSRAYLMQWGDDWRGKVPPHLYQYYIDKSFQPSDERRNVVILSFVLPDDISQGYHRLGRIAVSKFNGMKITSISDIVKAKKLNPESKYDVIEFEQDYPAVVIPRDKLAETDKKISQLYGIGKLMHIED